MERHERDPEATVPAQVVNEDFDVKVLEVCGSAREDIRVSSIFAGVYLQDLDLLIWPSFVQICLDAFKLVLIAAMNDDIETALA